MAVDHDCFLLQLAEEHHDGEDESSDQEGEPEQCQVIGLIHADAVLALPAFRAGTLARIVVQEQLVGTALALSSVGYVTPVTAGQAADTHVVHHVVSILQGAVIVTGIVEQEDPVQGVVTVQADVRSTRACLTWGLTGNTDTSDRGGTVRARFNTL